MCYAASEGRAIMPKPSNPIRAVLLALAVALPTVVHTAEPQTAASPQAQGDSSAAQDAADASDSLEEFHPDAVKLVTGTRIHASDNKPDPVTVIDARQIERSSAISMENLFRR